MQADSTYNRCAGGDINGDGYDDLVVGIPYASPNGTVTLYLGGPGGLAASPAWTWTRSSTAYATQVGWDVDLSGDANGDGYKDLAIGAWNYQNGNYEEGALFVFYGGPAGFGANPDWSFESNVDNSHTGTRLAWADANGDGYGDLFAASEYGSAYGFFGSPTGLPATPSWTVALSALNIANAGDLNGDGYDDLCLGRPSITDGPAGEGRVLVFPGSPSGPGGSPSQTLDPNVGNAQYGLFMNGGGDINGDGYDDLLLSSVNWSVPVSGAGNAQQLNGGPAGLNPSASWSVSGSAPYSFQGGQIWSLGDVDLDGFDDFAVGVAGNSPTWPGQIRVYLGGAGSLSTSPVWTYDNDANGMQLDSGWPGGDYNGDGKPDLAFSAHLGPGYRIVVFYNHAVAPSPGPSATASPSATPGSLSPTASPTASFSPSLTASPSGSVTPSPTPSASATAPDSASPSPTVSPTATASETATPTATPSDSASPSPSVSPTATDTATAAPTATPLDSASPSPSVSPTATDTATVAPTAPPPDSASPSPSASPTATASATAAPTSSLTPTPTWNFLGLQSPTPTPTLTPSASPEAHPEGPDLIHIQGVYPVPSDGPVNVYFTLRADAELDWCVYSVAGEKLREGRFSARAGRDRLLWDSLNEAGQRAASGVYLIRLSAPGVSERGSEAWVWAALAR